ncbi:MAG: GerMN domain-containing protein [bacterium]
MKRNLEQGNTILFSILIVSVIIAGVIILRFIKVSDYKKQNYDEMLRIIKEESINQPEPMRKELTLFLGVTNYTWHTQIISMNTPEYLVDIIKYIINEVLEKNINSIPEGTKLRSVFWTEDRIAYIDFTEEFVKNHPGGTWAEITSIYSIVNSLVYNFEEIKGVKILVDGKELPMISGHLDCLNPLVFREEP